MSVPTAIIKLGDNGDPIPSTAVVTQLDIVREVGKVSMAEITLADGNPAVRNFRLSEGMEFIPGTLIEIYLRYEGDPESEEPSFKGRIVKHSIEATVRGGYLKLIAKDDSIKMTAKRKKAVHLNLTDSALFTQLIEEN